VLPTATPNKLGYHPLLASRADTGEVLHARQRAGRANTARGTARYIDELVARLRRAGATGELTVRADSGFWSAKTIRALRRHWVRYSVTVRQTKPIRGGDCHHPRGCLDTDRLSRRWHRPGRRYPLSG
jgi:hypothetical protein